MKEFSPETVNAMGCYVYALIDPRVEAQESEKNFYVGKGTGQRCFQHAEAEISWKRNDDPNPKLELIRLIRNETGDPPLIKIMCWGMTDAEAHRVETILINVLQTDGNLVRGKYANDYCLTSKEVEGRYANPLQEDPSSIFEEEDEDEERR